MTTSLFGLSGVRPLRQRVAIGPRVQHLHGQVELLLQLQSPLFSDRSWADYQQTAFTLGPELAQHDSGLDRFAQSDFVGQNDALGEGGLQCEERCLDLMWIQVDRSVEERHGQSVHSTGGPARQVVGEILGVVSRDGHRSTEEKLGRDGLAWTCSVICQCCSPLPTSYSKVGVNGCLGWAFRVFLEVQENRGSRFPRGSDRGGPIPVARPTKSCLIPSAMA